MESNSTSSQTILKSKSTQTLVQDHTESEDHFVMRHSTQLSPKREKDSEEMEAKPSLSQIYKLSEFNPEKVTPLNRVKLFRWFMEELGRRYFYREVYSVACFYFDKFTEKSQHLDTSSMQICGLSCLMLAAKFCESRTFKVNHNIFPKEKLMDYELEVVKKLNFFLRPETYVHEIEFLTNKWDYFSQNANKNDDQILPAYTQKSQNSFLLQKPLFEKMECLNLVPSSRKFKTKEIAQNLFFIETFINFNKINEKTERRSLVLEELYEDILNKTEKSSYSKLFVSFMQCYQKNHGNYTLSLEIGLFLSPFLGLQSVESPQKFQNCVNYQYLKQVQTMNSNVFKLAISIIKENKN